MRRILITANRVIDGTHVCAYVFLHLMEIN